MSHQAPVIIGVTLANLKISLIEFGVSIVILAVFIALLALAGHLDFIGQWSNVLYLASFVGFTIVICLFGLKPGMSFCSTSRAISSFL